MNVHGRRIRSGFTLIELLVVLTIVGLLITLAVPRYFGTLDKSKEAVLREDLATMREALDKYYGDNARYPDTLEELVSKKYLRNIPRDPLTESNTTWVIVPPEQSGMGGVYDIRSGAAGTDKNGSAYAEW